MASHPLTDWQALTPREREILYQKYVEGMSLQQIGGQHGLSRERIRQILNKTRRKLNRVTQADHAPAEVVSLRELDLRAWEEERAAGML